MAAKVDPQLNKVVKEMRKRAGEIAEALLGGGSRPWINWAGLGATRNDEFSLREVFKRTSAGQDYVKARQSDKSKSKETAVPKICSDYLAGMERDTRARRRRWNRCIATASARAAANGSEKGPLTTHTTGWLARAFLKQRDKKTT